MKSRLDTSTMDDGMSSCNSDSNSNDDGHPPDKEKAAKELIGGGFKVFYDSMLKLIEEFSISASEYSMENVVQKLTLKRDEINCTKDKYERTIFHVTVEEKTYLLAKIFLAVAININAKESCGVTPSSIAVMNNDIAMCKLLLENFAENNAPFFGTVPSPKEMAVAMELTDTVELFTGYDKSKYSKSVALLENESVFTQPPVASLSENNDNTLGDLSEDTEDASNTFVYKRSEVSGFPTGIVGDVGMCKQNRSVRNRNNTAYAWSTDIPGVNIIR